MRAMYTQIVSAESPLFFCLPSVLAVCYFDEAFGAAEVFVAGLLRVFLVWALWWWWWWLWRLGGRESVLSLAVDRRTERSNPQQFLAPSR